MYDPKSTDLFLSKATKLVSTHATSQHLLVTVINTLLYSNKRYTLL